MSALVHGQALADLERDEEALNHFRQWLPRRRKANYHIIGSLGAIEMAHIFLRQGEIDRARQLLEQARTVIPKNEQLSLLHSRNLRNSSCLPDADHPRLTSLYLYHHVPMFGSHSRSLQNLGIITAEFDTCTWTMTNTAEYD